MPKPFLTLDSRIEERPSLISSRDLNLAVILLFDVSAEKNNSALRNKRPPSLQLPLLLYLILDFLGKSVNRRKLIHPFIGPAGINQHAIRGIAPRRALFGGQGRFADRGPDTFHHVQSFPNMTARRDGPYNVGGIGNVDV